MPSIRVRRDQARPSKAAVTHRGGRWAALAVLTAAVFLLLFATSASAEIVRLRVDWAPADGSPTMRAPYLFARSEDGSSGYPFESLCTTPSICEETRWLKQNLDAGGQPRTISFVDETAGQYFTYSFAAANPNEGLGPNIVGTATITHADGRSYTVPFDLAPRPPGGSLAVTSLGDSLGLPRPPPPPQLPTACSISFLKQRVGGEKAYLEWLKGVVSDFAHRWRSGDRLLLNNIYACGKGKITGRVVRYVGGRPVLVAKGAKVLDYKGPGRAGTKLKLTRTGRQLRAQGRTFRAKVTIRVFDGDGASITYSRKTKLRDGGSSTTTPRR